MDIVSPDTEACLVANIPLRPVGAPEEVAKVILFLCAAAASYATGTDVPSMVASSCDRTYPANHSGVELHQAKSRLLRKCARQSFCGQLHRVRKRRLYCLRAVQRRPEEVADVAGKGARIIHDQTDKMLHFENAQLDSSACRWRICCIFRRLIRL